MAEAVRPGLRQRKKKPLPPIKTHRPHRPFLLEDETGKVTPQRIEFNDKEITFVEQEIREWIEKRIKLKSDNDLFKNLESGVV